jgi:hypothetical protein
MTDLLPSPVRNTDHFLPYGEMLRCFVDQPEVPKSELSQLLRRRGVFLSSKDKSETVPVLVSSLIGVREFDVLLNAYTSKENKQKVITRSVPWDTKKTAIECVPDGVLQGIAKQLEFSNYTIISNSDFSPVFGDPDHIRMTFKIERKETSRNWCQATSVFEAQIDVEVIREDGIAQLAITHTANETKELASKAVNHVIQHFRENDVIAESAQAAQILFSSFNNEERVRFFMGFLRSDGDADLQAIDVVDLAIARDEDIQEELPESIAWFEEKIKRLRCRGKSLQEAAFVEDEECHRYIQLHAMEVSYSFDIKGAIGTCKVAFEFPRFESGSGRRSELQMTVLDIRMGKTSELPPVQTLRSLIIRALQAIALRRFAESKDTISKQ